MITREVTTLTDSHIARIIRNQLREFMTNDSSLITSAQQSTWFLQHSKSADKLYLHYDEHESPIGYSLIRFRDGVWLGTLAVIPDEQSKGYGTLIYRHMIDTFSEVHIEIFGDNNPSLVSALKSGFIIESMNDKTIRLVGRR